MHHVILHISYERVKHNKRGGSDGRHTCIQGGRSCAEARSSPKSLDPDENFNPKHTLICPILKFVAIYAYFGNLWTAKVFFGSKTVFLGKEMHYYIVDIANYSELNLQICNYAHKRRICREKKSRYTLGKRFYGHFCPRRKGANFCHPACTYIHLFYERGMGVQEKESNCHILNEWPNGEDVRRGRLDGRNIHHHNQIGIFNK